MFHVEHIAIYKKSAAVMNCANKDINKSGYKKKRNRYGCA